MRRAHARAPSCAAPFAPPPPRPLLPPSQAAKAIVGDARRRVLAFGGGEHTIERSRVEALHLQIRADHGFKFVLTQFSIAIEVEDGECKWQRLLERTRVKLGVAADKRGKGDGGRAFGNYARDGVA